MFKGFGSIFYKEIIQISRDPLTLALMLLVPMIQLLIFGYAINTDPRHLPAVVELREDGPMARAFLASLRASTYVDIVAVTRAAEEGASPGELLQVHLGKRHDRLAPSLETAIRQGFETDPRTLPRRERRRDFNPMTPEELARQDRIKSVRDRLAAGLSLVDNVKAQDFQARHLMLALDAGEPYRLARAFAIDVLTHRGQPPPAVREHAVGRAQLQTIQMLDTLRVVVGRALQPFDALAAR